MLRDVRFVRLIDALAEQSTELGARSVADVLWSLATLQHCEALGLDPKAAAPQLLPVPLLPWPGAACPCTGSVRHGCDLAR